MQPEHFEFWQGRRSRLHDRFRYSRPADTGGAWVIQRLMP
nr:pyridoxine 5'-phosphate oxidase C-terminal domain-containing protein [Acidithiobacillus sp. PG05]